MVAVEVGNEFAHHGYETIITITPGTLLLAHNTKTKHNITMRERVRETTTPT